MRGRPHQQPYAWLPGLIIIVMGGIIAVGTLALRHLEARLVAAAGSGLGLLAYDVADKLDQTLFERYSDAQMLSHTLGRHMHDVTVLNGELGRIKELSLSYRWLGVTNAQGTIIAATDQASLGTDRSQAPWFLAARDRPGVHTQDVAVSLEAGGVRTVGFSVSIFGAHGQFLGVMTTRVDLAQLEDVFARTVDNFRARQGENRRVEWQFVDREGLLIVDSLLREEDKVNLQHLGVLSARLSTSTLPGFVEEQHERRQIPVLTGYAQTQGYGEFPGFQWSILIRMDRDDVLAPIGELEQYLSVVGGAVLMPVFGFLVWSTGRLRTEWSRVRERYRDLVHSLDAIVWEGDPTTFRVTYASPQVHRLLGYSSDQWVNNEITWQDLIHPEDVASVFATCKTAVEAGRTHAIEYRMRTADGRIIWVKDLVTVVMADGRPVKLCGVLVDTTKEKEAEAAQRDCGAQLAAIIDSAMDAIVTVDADQRILIFNTAAERIFRCLAADAIGQPLDRFIPERFRNRHRRHFNAVAEGASPVRIKTPDRMLTGLRIDGEEFPAEIALSSVETEAGWRYTAVVRDVTEETRITRRRAAQYGVTQILAEATTLKDAALPLLEILCGTLDWDVGTLWIVSAETQALSCLEVWCRPDPALGAFAAITRQRTFAHGAGLPGRIWSTGQPLWIPDVVQDENVPRAEAAAAAGLRGAVGFPILRESKILGIVEFFSERVAQPDQDMLAMLSSVGSQIGLFIERKQAESKAWVLLQAIEASIESIVLADLQGVITYANPAAARMFQYVPEELIGKPARNLYPEDARVEQFPAILAAARETGWSGEVAGLRKDGTRFPRWMSVSPTRDAEGTLLGLVSVSRDITETKLMEAQAWRLERLATLGQLLSGVAHELKNPLFILTGRLQLLEEKLARQEYATVETDMQKIEAAAHRMTTITERFLSLARPVPPCTERCSVEGVLQEVLEFLANELMKNRIRVERVATRDLPRIVSDPGQLNEVFLNLMLNAMQAMAGAHGQGTLTVTTALARDAATGAGEDAPAPATEGDWIDVRIQDDGPGIRPEHRAKLFEPFYSTKPPGQGTGLGLWAVRSIIMTLKGTVTYETEVGRGTTFIVRLPVTEGHIPSSADEGG